MPGTTPEIGVGISGSTSSGASLSGAIDASQGAKLGTTNYGPGTLVIPARGDAAVSAATGAQASIGWPAIAVLGGLVLLALFLARRMGWV